MNTDAVVSVVSSLISITEQLVAHVEVLRNQSASVSAAANPNDWNAIRDDFNKAVAEWDAANAAADLVDPVAVPVSPLASDPLNPPSPSPNG